MAEVEVEVPPAAAIHKPPEPKHLGPEDLVARAIAPVKTEYLRSPPLRSCTSKPPAGDCHKGDGNGAGGVEKTNGKDAGTVIAKEKKSRRQLKRDRQKERKSAKNLCPEIARTGNVSSCIYGSSCRFSHDLDGFLEQKPEDLPGKCPFVDDRERCPYGLACRFSRTHSESTTPGVPCVTVRKSEMNFLSKEFQKLLWKNKVKFLKADAQLKVLGLVKGKNSKENKEEEKVKGPCSSLHESSNPQGNGSGELICTPSNAESPSETCLKEGDSGFDEIRPLKKAKIPFEVQDNTKINNNGVSHVEEAISVMQIESEKDTPSNNFHASEVEIVPILHRREKKLIDFRDKLYLAPLTTVGNLPFRRVCKVLGADITCGEMAMCTNLLQGQASEWALLRRHSSEDLFGIQLCGAYPDTVARTVELIDRECVIDFVDINMGCPIDIVVNKGAGSSLLTKPMRMKNIIQAVCGTIDKPITVKVRTGYFEGRNRIDSLIADISQWGANAITIHGRSRQQRYSKLADWNYISECAKKAPASLHVLGNGDIFSHHDWSQHKSSCPQLSTCMIARGALIKPWIFTEIKEERLWDITSAERFDILKKFVHFGLEHWGSDNKGVETTRHFLLEWLSYTYRYIPLGLLDVIPQRINWRPPTYYGRNDLETLMSSDSAADWIRISEMLLGKVPDGFSFTPKHKSNAYDSADNG